MPGYGLPITWCWRLGAPGGRGELRGGLVRGTDPRWTLARVVIRGVRYHPRSEETVHPMLPIADCEALLARERARLLERGWTELPVEALRAPSGDAASC